MRALSAWLPAPSPTQCLGSRWTKNMSSHDGCQPSMDVTQLSVGVLCSCCATVCVAVGLCVTMCSSDTERRILRALENNHVAFEDQKLL